MSGEKPIREMDTILVRVPDGMKKRVVERARANGRSISAEVLDILENAMEEAGSARMRELESIIKTVTAEQEALQARLHELHGRREAAREELIRRQMVRKVRERKKKEAEDGNP